MKSRCSLRRKPDLRRALLGVLVLMLLAVCPGRADDSLYDGLQDVLHFPARIEEAEKLLTDLLANADDLWADATDQLGDTTSVLQTSTTLRATTFPWLAEAAIADYREALRRDFVQKVGRPDGWLSMAGLTSLAAHKRLFEGSSAASYLAAHDKDGDGRLTIDEFVPTPAAVAKSSTLPEIVSTYIRSLPYPTGQSPVASATAFGLRACSEGLFSTREEIEQRIVAYASKIGGTTYTRPDGRMGAKDSSGAPIDPLPETVVPLHKREAEQRLREYLQKTGGTGTFAPNKPAEIRDANGLVIPLEKWPAHTQPPYHPVEGPPPSP